MSELRVRIMKLRATALSLKDPAARDALLAVASGMDAGLDLFTPSAERRSGAAVSGHLRVISGGPRPAVECKSGNRNGLGAGIRPPRANWIAVQEDLDRGPASIPEGDVAERKKCPLAASVLLPVRPLNLHGNRELSSHRRVQAAQASHERGCVP